MYNVLTRRRSDTKEINECRTMDSASTGCAKRTFPNKSAKNLVVQGTYSGKMSKKHVPIYPVYSIRPGQDSLVIIHHPGDSILVWTNIYFNCLPRLTKRQPKRPSLSLSLSFFLYVCLYLCLPLCISLSLSVSLSLICHIVFNLSQKYCFHVNSKWRFKSLVS